MPKEWNPKEEELEVIDSAWIQLKVYCEKKKEHTNAAEKNIAKIPTK